MFIRRQATPHLTDLAPDFLEAFLATLDAFGIDAGRVFALGA